MEPLSSLFTRIFIGFITSHQVSTVWDDVKSPVWEIIKDFSGPGTSQNKFKKVNFAFKGLV